MRMFAQDKSFCRTLRVDETICPVALESACGSRKARL